MKPGSRKMSLANRQLNDFTPDRKSSADMIRYAERKFENVKT